LLRHRDRSRVHVFALLDAINGQIKALQDVKKMVVDSAANAGRDNGTTIRRKMPNSESPSTRAASRRSLGIDCKKLCITKMPNGLAHIGRMIPRYPSARWSFTIKTKRGIKVTSNGKAIAV